MKKRLLLLVAIAVFIGLAGGGARPPAAVFAAPPPPPTGVDGVIGPEWNGVTPTFVPFVGPPSGATGTGGDLVAYNVYVRADANYMYVGLQAVPQCGDMWDVAFILSNTKGNVYLDNNVTGSSNLLLLMADDPPDYCDSTDTVCNFSNVGPLGPSVFVAYNPGAPPACPANPGIGAVQELAVPWSVLQNDPDAIGFPKVVCNVNVRTVQAFGNNFNGSQFGTIRFGTVTAPGCVGPPTNKDQCKNGGWQTFNVPRKFKNQGDCIQFVNTGK